jgi:hypothetical protein
VSNLTNTNGVDRMAATTVLIAISLACIVVGALLVNWTLQYSWSDYSFAVTNGLGSGWGIGAIVAALPSCVGVPIILFGTTKIIHVGIVSSIEKGITEPYATIVSVFFGSSLLGGVAYSVLGHAMQAFVVLCLYACMMLLLKGASVLHGGE